MEAADFVAVLGGTPDPDHDLGAGDEGSEQLAAADPALLRDREPRRQQRGARVHAGARPGEVVHLEGMRERAVGQRRRRRVHQRAGRTENTAAAAGAVALGIGDDDLAPGQLVAEDDAGDGVGDAMLGALDDVGRDIVIAQRRRVLGHPASSRSASCPQVSFVARIER